jgi:hypothetical protein
MKFKLQTFFRSPPQVSPPILRPQTLLYYLTDERTYPDTPRKEMKVAEENLQKKDGKSIEKQGKKGQIPLLLQALGLIPTYCSSSMASRTSICATSAICGAEGASSSDSRASIDKRSPASKGRDKNDRT